MPCWIKRLALALLVLPLAAGAAQAQLRGHGGPVRALAISPDGTRAVSGSFDTSAIRWSLKRNVAMQVMRFHDNAVNAVVYLKDGRIATGRRRCAYRDLDAGQGEAGHGAQRPHRAHCRRRRFARRQVARFGVVGSHRAAVAARRRRAARAQGQRAERQRRRLHARRQAAHQRRLRHHHPHLVAGRRAERGRASSADAAQHGGGRARWRDRHRRRQRQGLFPVAAGRGAR